MKEKLKGWLAEVAEEGTAESVTEMAIDQLPPVVVLFWLSWGLIALSVILGLVGWYFQTGHVLAFIFAALTGFAGGLLYLVRLYVVAKLSKLLLKGYRHVKGQVLARVDGAVAGDVEKVLPPSDRSKDEAGENSEAEPRSK